MPRVTLSGMTVEALMDLRRRVDETLHQHRAKLQKQLEMMAVVGSRRVVRGGGSALRGRKVPPKYRGPSGETWAGRGAKPKWLVAAIKGGKKLDQFLIDKSAKKRRKERNKHLVLRLFSHTGPRAVPVLAGRGSNATFGVIGSC